MRQQIEQSLQQLKVDYESGQNVLADLENRQVNLS